VSRADRSGAQGYHTYDAYEELFAGSKSHLAVVYAWLVGKKKRGARMWTDGKRLYSYGMVLGCTLSGDYKVMRQMTSRTGCFVSQSTSTHSNLAARYADLVFVAEFLRRCGLLEFYVQEACVGDCRSVAEDEVAPPRLARLRALSRGLCLARSL
jgi:hypothetical protein